MFLTSPRNSVAAQKSLFEHLNCKTIVSPNPRPIFTTALLGACKLNIIEVPSVEDLLGKEHHPFPFDKAFEDALSEPFFAV